MLNGLARIPRQPLFANLLCLDTHANVKVAP